MAVKMIFRNRDFQTVALQRGESFAVRGQLPLFTTGFVGVYRHDNHAQLIAQRDIIAVVAGLDDAWESAENMIFIRNDRWNDGGQSLKTVWPKKWPVLRNRLRDVGFPIATPDPGIFENVPTYNDEVGVVNELDGGGWIIRKDEIDRCLNGQMPIPDSGETGVLWIDHPNWHCRQGIVRICMMEPADIDGLHEERQTFRVEYDCASKMVTRIVNLPDLECRSASYTRDPLFVEVDKYLPFPI